ncbi:arv1-like family domain-containing protein [Ditylenchus destructor]|uniref:Protein ARV n=1 Tax=Ditylenchus destructor TaxID=166010 RepID=A0AAD4MRU1_9BILA|nr:arv1-like family domain-containing protein [Ditylenchus destructor]
MTATKTRKRRTRKRPKSDTPVVSKDKKPAESSRKYVCVNCLKEFDSLYTIYSRDVIRITDCYGCGEAVDKYVEYDIVLIFIDLILQYSSAYRHLLLNTEFNSHYRLASIFLLCDSYDKWIERRTAELSPGEAGQGIYDLEWHFYGSLVQSLSEFLAYTFTIYALMILAFCFGNKSTQESKINGFLEFLKLTVMGFYGNIFVVFSIVWKLHQHWSYRSLTQLFLAVSHVQVQRTLFPRIHWLQNSALVLCGILAQNIMGTRVKNALEFITFHISFA